MILCNYFFITRYFRGQILSTQIGTASPDQFLEQGSGESYQVFTLADWVNKSCNITDFLDS